VGADAVHLVVDAFAALVQVALDLQGGELVRYDADPPALLIGAGVAMATAGMTFGTIITTGIAFAIEALALKGYKVLKTFSNPESTGHKVAQVGLMTLAVAGAVIGTSFALAGSFLGLAVIAIAKKPDSVLKGVIALIGSVALTTLLIYGHYKAFEWSMH
jgi:hypothetical protein